MREPRFPTFRYSALPTLLALAVSLFSILFSNSLLLADENKSTDSADAKTKISSSHLSLHDNISQQSLSRNLLLLIDEEENLNAKEIAAMDDDQFLVEKFTSIKLEEDKTHWLKLKLDQEEFNPTQKEWLVELFVQDKANELEVFIQNPNKTFSPVPKLKQSFSILKGRKFNSSAHVIHLFDNDPALVLIRVKPEVKTNLTASLWNPTYIETSNNQISSIIGVFYGVLLLVFLYNLFLNITVGDITYSFFLLYLAAVGVFMLTLSGLGSIQLWGFLPALSIKIALSSGAGALLWGNLLCLSILDTKKHSPIINKLLLAAIPVSVCLALSPFFIDVSLISWYFFIASGVVYLLTTAAVLKNWQEVDHHPARLYFLALLCLPLGLAVYLLNSYDLFPYPMVGYFSFHIAFATHLLLLSLGLIDRTQNEYRLRYIELGKQHQSIMAARRSEDEMLARALHDGLTGFPNRLALQKRMPEIIREAEIYQQSIAVVLINLSHFHEINNTLGHQNGDDLLKIVTKRLAEIAGNLENSTVIDNDANKACVAAVEGVTYAIVLLVDTQQQVEFAAKRVLTSMRKHFEFRDMSIDIGVRLGVALYPGHGKDLNTLIRRALVAMENADKNATHLTMYSPELDPYSPRRLALMGELSSAIDNDNLLLYFQPQVDIENNSVIGVEALARWKHHEHGFIPPDEFIPLAEKTGLTRKLTRWVLDKALEECAFLLSQGMEISVSVNLSSQNLHEPNFETRVKSLLAKHKVPPNFLMLELTETAVMLDPNHAQEVLTKLHEDGIRISIDDFGTGYSSLSYIKRLPLDEVKIDKSFIMDMVNDKDDSVIVDTTLHMSHNLGLRVVAEGVENEDTLNALREIGCDIAQGYYLTRPLSASDLLAWLKSCSFEIGDKRIVKQDLIPDSFSDDKEV